MIGVPSVSSSPTYFITLPGLSAVGVPTPLVAVRTSMRGPRRNPTASSGPPPSSCPPPSCVEATWPALFFREYRFVTCQNWFAPPLAAPVSATAAAPAAPAIRLSSRSCAQPYWTDIALPRCCIWVFEEAMRCIDRRRQPVPRISTIRKTCKATLMSGMRCPPLASVDARRPGHAKARRPCSSQASGLPGQHSRISRRQETPALCELPGSWRGVVEEDLAVLRLGDDARDGGIEPADAVHVQVLVHDFFLAAMLVEPECQPEIRVAEGPAHQILASR